MLRQGGAGEVGAEDPSLRAELRRRDGHVRGDGRLADAALVGGDGDHVLHAGDRLRPALAGRRTAHLRAPVDLDLVDALDGGERGADVSVDGLAEGACGRCEHQLEGDATAVQLQVAHHVQGDDVAVQFRVVHCAQSGEHHTVVYQVEESSLNRASEACCREPFTAPERSSSTEPFTY